MLRPIANQALGGPTQLPSAHALLAALAITDVRAGERDLVRASQVPRQGHSPLCSLAPPQQVAPRSAQGHSAAPSRVAGMVGMGTWKSICPASVRRTPHIGEGCLHPAASWRAGLGGEGALARDK